MSIPVMLLSNSPARWLVEPLPDDPQNSVPGFALARATSSVTLPTPTDGCTASTIGTEAIRATGANALDGSYRRSLYSSVLIVSGGGAVSNSV